MNPRIALKRHAKSTQRKAHNGDRTSPGSRGSERINVGDMEREISLVGGSLLALFGLLRGRVSGLALAAIGGALVWRGHTGHCQMYEMLGHSTASNPAERQTKRIQQNEELSGLGSRVIAGD